MEPGSNASMCNFHYDLQRPGWDNHELVDVLRSFIHENLSEPEVFARKRNKLYRYQRDQKKVTCW